LRGCDDVGCVKVKVMLKWVKVWVDKWVDLRWVYSSEAEWFAL